MTVMWLRVSTVFLSEQLLEKLDGWANQMAVLFVPSHINSGAGKVEKLVINERLHAGAFQRCWRN
jgi:hypothetical protein